MYLQELNYRGQGEVVKYSGWRPIVVVEGDLNKNVNNDYKLGMATPLPAYCLIVMDKYLEDPVLYKQVLWHEYFHCFYYGHSKNESDIMAPYLDPSTLDESTVDNYLKELGELYE